MENDPDHRLLAYGRLAVHTEHVRLNLAALNQTLSNEDLIENCIEKTLFECARRITISHKLSLSEKLTALDSLRVESMTLFRKVLERRELTPVIGRIHKFFRTQVEEARTIELQSGDPFVVATQRCYWFGQYQNHHVFSRGDAAREIGVGRTDITEWIRHRNRKKSKIEPVLLSYRTLEDLQEIPDVESILAQCAAIVKFFEFQTVAVAARCPEEAPAILRAARIGAEQSKLLLLEESASPGDRFASRRQREIEMHAGLSDPTMDPRLKNDPETRGGLDVSDRNAWKRDRSKQANAIERILGKLPAISKTQEHRVMFRSTWKNPKGPADLT